MRRDLKIMMSSNAPWSNSGYGRFVDDWSQRVLKDKWPISLVAWAGLAGGSIDYKGVKCYPQYNSIWGEDGLLMHGNHFKADVRFSMQDVHAMNPQILAQLPHWIPYTPIDREEVQPVVLEVLKYAYKIITFSKFGQKALMKYGFASTMIPEGVDTNIFKPLDKTEIRKKLNFPQDKFIIGMIGANKPDGISRKNWQQALDAFAVFAKNHEDAMFFWESNQGGGFDIQGYANFLGVGNRLMTVNPYSAMFDSNAETVNEWLNCCDMILNVSSTEGFGLVITEAQSAGTPVIINNVMSMPELIKEGVTGEAVKKNTKLWTQGGGYVFLPDIADFADKMEILWKRIKIDPEKVRKDCREWILANYDIDKIYKEYWTPYLEQLQVELVPPVDESAKKV